MKLSLSVCKTCKIVYPERKISIDGFMSIKYREIELTFEKISSV